MSKTILETVTGKKFDVLNPKSEMVSLDDIAWSLSRQSRFNGHTIPVIPFSVAQHSIHVAEYVAKRYDLSLVPAALMHDAAEAYISDIPSPIKHIPEVRTVIKKLELNILDVIFEALDISWPDESGWECIEYADMYCRRVEAYQFMYSRGNDWEGLPEVSLLDLQKFEEPMASVEVYERFLKYWEQIKICRKNLK